MRYLGVSSSFKHESEMSEARTCGKQGRASKSKLPGEALL